LWIGGIGLLVLNMILWLACYALLKSGWKIKN
jgi:ABC-2 type transport system permease protein